MMEDILSAIVELFSAAKWLLDRTGRFLAGEGFFYEDEKIEKFLSLVLVLVVFVAAVVICSNT